MPMTSITTRTRLRQVLLALPESGPTLERLGVDAARDGQRTLAELSARLGLEARTLARLLAAAEQARSSAPAVCVELMTLGELCDHLEAAHGRLHHELARLDRLTRALSKGKAAENPKLRAIRNGFLAFQRRFRAHLRKEADHLFPVCRGRAAGRKRATEAGVPWRSPLSQLQQEHSQADEALADLRRLVADDAPSATEHAAVRAVADAVARLESSIHEQIYKENHLLFPKALPRRPRAN